MYIQAYYPEVEEVKKSNNHKQTQKRTYFNIDSSSLDYRSRSRRDKNREYRLNNRKKTKVQKREVQQTFRFDKLSNFIFISKISNIIMTLVIIENSR